jgi:hypothetical protein
MSNKKTPLVPLKDKRCKDATAFRCSTGAAWKYIHGLMTGKRSMLGVQDSSPPSYL